MKEYLDNLLIKGIENLTTGLVQIDDIEDITCFGKITYIKTNGLFYVNVKLSNREVIYYENDILSYEENILRVVKVK